MNNEHTEKFINSLKATSEALYILYSSLIEQGFKETEAIYLTGEYLKSIVKGA